MDLLILDDFGSCKVTDWATDRMFNILDSRQGKHTIFTTSKNSKAIKELYKNDIFSRMNFKSKDWAFTLNGEDMRKQ